MKVINFNRKEGIAKIRVDTLDDLWHLSKIVEIGDFISGEIKRKVKLSGEGERSKVVVKNYFAKIKTNKVKLESAVLKVSGEILAGSEELQIGAAHTLDIFPEDVIKIEKPWKDYQLRRLEDAERASKAPKALVVILDDEQAHIAALTASGFQYLAGFELRLAKKRFVEKTDNGLGKVVAEILRINSESNPEIIIVASPIFWKETMFNALKEKDAKIVKKIKLESSSTGTKRAFNELINRGILEKILKKSQLQKEFELIEELLVEIAKKGLAAYGKDVIKAVEANAVRTLLFTDEIIEKAREKEKFGDFEQLIDKVEQQGGEVHIISTDNEAGEKLKGLGGIGALLRYKLT
ncbi:MAG TPA: mRNA surveillance protein pelota [Nanoarchaeota archaeon]|nr:mRNA surveillance protein pelota [Nanoarchaeota archaeon]